jgi:hypothetical protein
MCAMPGLEIVTDGHCQLRGPARDTAPDDLASQLDSIAAAAGGAGLPANRRLDLSLNGVRSATP